MEKMLVISKTVIDRAKQTVILNPIGVSRIKFMKIFKFEGQGFESSYDYELENACFLKKPSQIELKGLKFGIL